MPLMWYAGFFYKKFPSKNMSWKDTIKLTKTEYNYATDANPINTYNYAYGDSNWKDKLTSYNGKAITYDAIGNPLTYDGWTFTWEEGRQLSSMSKTGTNISYKYNDNGIRTEKNVNGVVTKYHLNGDDVTYEDNGTDKIYYTYDSSGKLISMNLNGTEYYYTRNAQGDIIGLFYTNGNDVVSYTYDTWGKLISIDGSLKDTVGVKNPYRYRSYRYDSENGLYYLQSRYYSPEWGRFINADAIAGHTGELLGHNIFAYCKNNVVNKQDSSGYLAEFNTDRWDDDYSPSQFSLSDYENFISNQSPLANFIEGATGKTLITGETLSSQEREEKIGKGLDRLADGMIMCSTAPSSEGIKYKAPKGGGGITSKMKINEFEVTFGHGARHIEAAGLDIEKVNKAIANDVVKQNLAKGQFYKGIIIFDGQKIQYTSFGVGKNTINVGTSYHIP